MSDPTVREAMEKLASALGADPARAHVRSTPATARLSGGLKCEIDGERGERAVSDMPAGMGGKAAAPNPSWYLRAGMASCTATVIAMRAAKLGIDLKTLEVTVDSESDQRGILGLDERVSAALSGLRMRVRIAGSADAKTLRELVTWSEAHSPVGCTVRGAPALSLDIEVA